MRRCLLDEFTLAAEAEQWQLLSLEQEQAQTQAASSPTRMDRDRPPWHSPPRPGAPEDCMTSPQALMMSASPNDAWQPGRLREVMQVPHMNFIPVSKRPAISPLTGPSHPRALGHASLLAEGHLMHLLLCLSNCRCHLKVPER